MSADWIDRARRADAVTRMGLELLVPLAIIQLRERGGPTEADFVTARDVGARLAHGGDWLESRMLGSAEKGASKPPSLAEIAKALACAAWTPGGVTLWGAHYKEKP